MKLCAWGLGGWLFCILGGTLGVAHAQSSAQTVTDERRPRPMDDHVEDRPAVDEHGQPLYTGREKEEEEDADPMAWLGLGLKVGFSRIGSSSLANPTYRDKVAQAAIDSGLSNAELREYGLTGEGGCGIIDRRCKVQGRVGLQLSVPINLGGDGFGFLFEPYINVAKAAKAYGGYLGPTFNIHVADPLYLGFGFGLKGAWVIADGWDYAADLYARVPIHATFYMINDIALVADLGFAFGGSGYISKPVSYTIPVSMEKRKSLPQMTFGAGLNIDAAIGVRFP